MPTAQEILAYFGTFTAGTDGAANAFQFEYLTTLGFAAIVIFLGHAIVNHSGCCGSSPSPRRWCPACCSPL